MARSYIEYVLTQLEKYQYVSPITEKDEELFQSFLNTLNTYSKDKISINFEDSFEYIRLYFNSGRYQGFKYHDDENMLCFALEKKKKPHFKLFKPLGTNAMKKMPELIASLSSITKYPIHVVCLNNDILQALKKERKLKIKNIKEFSYYIYDLETLAGLRGVRWKNVRQKITTFKKNYPQDKIKIEPLTTESCDDVVHFIGAWRRAALNKKSFSFVNIEKNKFAARYYADKIDSKNIWSNVYRLRDQVVAFQLLYRLGPAFAAHAIGLADNNIKGLSEFSQVHTWELLQKTGIRFINDGPSWRPGLERYKRKFNPASIQKVFECKIVI